MVAAWVVVFVSNFTSIPSVALGVISGVAAVYKPLLVKADYEGRAVKHSDQADALENFASEKEKAFAADPLLPFDASAALPAYNSLLTKYLRVLPMCHVVVPPSDPDESVSKTLRLWTAGLVLMLSAPLELCSKAP